MSRTVDVIHAEMLSNVSNDYEKTAGYPVYDLTRAVAIAIAQQESDTEKAEEKLDVNNLKEEELERFINQRTGITRKAANAATGVLQITGTGTISVNDLFETSNGVQFKATKQVTITGSGTVNIIAVIAGNSGVVGANTITMMPVSIPGIVSVNNLAATVDGYDAETDDALRSRYYVSLQTPATSGNKYHYKEWALAVSGVGGAKVVPLWNGVNTVKVIIVDSDMLPANSTLVERTQAYIDPGISGRGEGQAPMGAYCTVVSATGLSINVSAKLTIESTAVRGTVEDAIEEDIIKYLKSIAFESSSVSYAKIGEAILGTSGVVDYENLIVNTGTSNIAVNDNEVAILGTAVWTYA